MRNKIVHILCHSLILDNDINYYVYGGFGPRQIRGLRPYMKEFTYEVWCAVVGLKKNRIIKKDGIIYKLFPAWTLNKTLESFFPIVVCRQMFRELEKQNSRQIIIHFQGERGTLLHYLLFKYPRYKVLIQYHGYGQPLWLDWLEALFITPIEKLNFPRVKHFFVPIKPRVEYLIKKIGIHLRNISSENIGLDFKLFKPANKFKSRKKLGIPQKVFVILYVGHLMKSKGADKIFKAVNVLSKNYSNLFLLVVGALENDPLYDKLKGTANRIVNFVSNEKMPIYLNASDVLCFYGNEKNIRFAGPGIAPTEALACNLNVISTNLAHFDDKIVKKLGFIPKNNIDLLRYLKFLIKNPTYTFSTRSMIEPYVSFRSISKKIKRVYEACLTY